jgi:choline dehydrogenase
MVSSTHRGRSFWAALAVTLFSGFASVSASGKQCQPVATYDYIVVGSGPGGGIVASNLALAGHSVLLLEAGADASDDVATSVNALSYPQNPNYQWSFFVKHHGDAEVEARYRLLTWTLPDGTYWVGPKADAPAGAQLNGVWYVPHQCRSLRIHDSCHTDRTQVPAWRHPWRECHGQRHGLCSSQRCRLEQDCQVGR